MQEHWYQREVELRTICTNQTWVQSHLGLNLVSAWRVKQCDSYRRILCLEVEGTNLTINLEVVEVLPRLVDLLDSYPLLIFHVGSSSAAWSNLECMNGGYRALGMRVKGEGCQVVSPQSCQWERERPEQRWAQPECCGLAVWLVSHAGLWLLWPRLWRGLLSWHGAGMGYAWLSVTRVSLQTGFLT